MAFADALLPEFDQEMASTRKVLERIPDDKFGWRAHPKPNTTGWNASHVVEIPSWVVFVLTQPSLDVAPVGGEPYKTPTLTTSREVVEAFDRNVAEARKAVAGTGGELAGGSWSLMMAGEPIITMPRAATIRTFVMNYLVHHRAHLCAYLRLNDVPVPGMYGPTCDE